jgi:hypothetical protein
MRAMQQLRYDQPPLKWITGPVVNGDLPEARKAQLSAIAGGGARCHEINSFALRR